MLLHNGNELASLPVAQSVQMKETYENMKTLINKHKYDQHQWLICGDLKVTSKMTGLESYAWNRFKSVVENFLGNHKSVD